MIDTFRVGEDVVVLLDARKGSVAGVTSIAVEIAEAYYDGGPVKGTPVAIDDVQARAAVGRTPAGWTVTIAGAVTATMAPGIYAIDAKVTVGSHPDIAPDTAYIQLKTSLFG